MVRPGWPLFALLWPLFALLLAAWIAIALLGGRSPNTAPAPLADKRALFDAEPEARTPSASEPAPALPAEKQAMVAEIRRVDAEGLNLRQAPGTGSKVLAVLPRDTILRVEAVRENWLRVAAPDGTRGWVSARYARTGGPTVSARNSPAEVRAPSRPLPTPGRRSRAAIIREIIAESLAAYSGPCPCPYSVSRSGRCGGRSAWSKPGGAEPLCFAEDIPEAMIAARR